MARRAALCLAVLVAVTVVWAQPRVLKPAVLRTNQLTLQPLSLQQNFEQLLVTRKVPADKQQVMLSEFKTLPNGMQDIVLAAMDDNYAARKYYLPAHKFVLRPDHVLVLVPTISNLYPKYGAPPGGWVIVTGTTLRSGDKILWDGTEIPTTFYGPGLEFFPNSLGFSVPAGTPLASDHSVVVKRTATVQSASKTYRCCSLRGYRGLYGWKFANFGDPTIPWNMYKDFFGQAAVEYANGTHRPAAQTWYDATYKGVGGGGNCYGMSNSSLRLKNGNMTTYHKNWFTANPQDYCWFYPWNTQTKESVQEDQGGQLSAEMAATINDYWNNQDHKEAWNRINSLKSEVSNKPVVCFWGPGWGHAVVGYNTAIVGSQHNILWYDNNQPYAENETGGPDKSTAYVDWNNSSFHANSYATANKMICLSYNECMRPPHLPTAAGGPGASTTGTVVAVVEGGQVQQIEDENGRQFFGANGAENTNANTRIPNSMRFIPAQAAGTPYNGPGIFIFNNASNKNLTFTVGGGGQKALSFFQPGDVFRTEFAGQGQLKLNNILTPTRNLELPNPGALQPSRIRFIRAEAAERVFELQNLNLGDAAAVMGIAIEENNALEVLTAAAGRFDLRVETFAGNQLGQALFRNIATQMNSRAQLAPENWNNLGGSRLNLNLRGLNNQQIQQLRINQ
jgi:hypothetical protein